MTEARTFNVYCDESCHLEHDGVPVMAWGAVYCSTDAVRSVTDGVRALKTAHGLAPTASQAQRLQQSLPGVFA